MPLLQIGDQDIEYPEGTAPEEVVAALNRDIRLANYLETPWVARASRWDTPDKDGSTVRTESAWIDELGAEILYPTLRMKDGELHEVDNPLKVALEQGDFIVADSPEDATRVSKELSDFIGANREEGKAAALDQISTMGHYAPFMREGSTRGKGLEAAGAAAELIGDMNYRELVELGVAFTPVVGDISGLGYDAQMYEDPEAHTPLNYIWTLAAAAPILGAMIPSPGAIKRLFHVSEKDFDEFDTSHALEGAGAQSRGHGVYAGDEGVRDAYQGSMRRKDWHGQEVNPITYELDVAADFDNEILDLDADLLDQRHITDRIQQSLGEEAYSKLHAAMLKNADGAKLTGEDLRMALTRQFSEISGEPLRRSGLDFGKAGDMTAQYLDQVGIKGSRYRDAHGKNYVIHNPAIIDIAKKYSLAIPAAAIFHAYISEKNETSPEA